MTEFSSDLFESETPRLSSKGFYRTPANLLHPSRQKGLRRTRNFAGRTAQFPGDLKAEWENGTLIQTEGKTRPSLQAGGWTWSEQNGSAFVWFDMEYWNNRRRLFFQNKNFWTLHHLCSRFFISTPTLHYSITPCDNEVAVNLSPLG